MAALPLYKHRLLTPQPSCCCRRQIAVFSFLGIGLLVAVILWLGVLLNHPASVKVCTAVLLLLLLIIWLLVVVATAALKVGNDGASLAASPSLFGCSLKWPACCWLGAS